MTTPTEEDEMREILATKLKRFFSGADRAYGEHYDAADVCIDAMRLYSQRKADEATALFADLLLLHDKSDMGFLCDRDNGPPGESWPGSSEQLTALIARIRALHTPPPAGGK